MFDDWKDNFQTPPSICQRMSDECSSMRFIHKDVKMDSWILEPTPGQGRLYENLCVNFGSDIVTKCEGDIFEYSIPGQVASIVMNPPFSPMTTGYKILHKMMHESENVKVIVAVMPWLTLINSTRRMNDIEDWGLKEVIHLTRKAFPKSRVQTCIMAMFRGWSRKTEFSYIREI